VMTAAVSPGGELVIAGGFAMAGDVPVTGLAVRDGDGSGRWRAIAPGLPTSLTVTALTFAEDGRLYVGGSTYDDSGWGTRVLRYDGASVGWTQLGSGLGPARGLWRGDVWSLTVLPDGDVIATGSFGTLTGDRADGIARYRVAVGKWMPLGGTEDGLRLGGDQPGWILASMPLPGGDVLVGGWFDRVGEMEVLGVACYRPSTNTWSAVGGGVRDPGGTAWVSSLTMMPDGDVAVGGRFSLAGGRDGAGSAVVRNVARYNPAGDAWAPLGAGVEGSVKGMFVKESGDLLAVVAPVSVPNWPGDTLAAWSAGTGAWSTTSLGGADSQVAMAVAAVPTGETFVVGERLAPQGIDRGAVAFLKGPAEAAVRIRHGAPACLGAQARVLEAASASGVVSAWQWRPRSGVEWRAVVEGVNSEPGGVVPAFVAAGSGGSSLSLRDVTGRSERQLRAVVTDACGVRVSVPVAVRVCVADFDCDRVRTVRDVFEFIGRFRAGDSACDIDGAAGVGVSDLYRFLSVWFAGCP
ncbi:MAG: hypothetical protein K2Q20_02390, partial [Phycisphaerales bacterium]|nr:hypothetical protein [Phycisphaerales bacterium]